VTESGTNEFFGTFYAPRATLTIHQTADLLGSAIADNFVHGGPDTETAGDWQTYLFQGTLSSCDLPA
jgi:hypothetical protein